ncbi:MAG: D-alanyl-D-alanine carboxypeptidase, partial [Actinobacteria bacterium]|nr:D-alanyl-D-alanine carboxypeptidase [Actinomycetota bacterium]
MAPDDGARKSRNTQTSHPPIPGISASSEPYDAPNGALCVNFNTVYFKRTNKGYISAEPQTPLLPMAMKKITLSKVRQGRIVLSSLEKENTLYAGQLFRYFLEKNNMSIHGSVKSGLVNKDTDCLILRHISPFALTEIISKLLEHSNNFTTNQLLIAAGINDSGQPGNLTKGVQAARKYAQNILGTSNMKIVEGSGISRDNRVTAAQMNLVLDTFEPYHTLLRREGRQYYKTGTLHGISTRAGFIQTKSGELYPFVVMLNTP